MLNLGAIYGVGLGIFPLASAKTNTATNQIVGQLNKVDRAVEQTSTSFKSLAGAFTGLWAGRLVAGALQAMIAPSARMETAMARLSTLTGQTGESLDAFKRKAMDVAAITTFGPTELADALTRLQQVTGNASSAMAALAPTAQLAMASFGRINLQQSVEMMGYLVKGFSLTGDEATIAAQRVFTASKVLGVGIESYTKVMDRLASAARIGTQSYDEIIKVFGLLSREMHSSESAATALRRSMQFLGTSKGQGALREMGLIVTGDTGGVLPMHKIIEELSQRLPRDTQRTMNILTEALGKKAAPAILSLVGQYRAIGGAAGWDKLSKKMMTDTGALQEASEKWMNTYAGQAELLKDSFENLSIVLGDKLLPVFKDLTSGLKDFVSMATYTIQGTWVGSIIGPAAKGAAIVAGVWALTAAFQGMFRILGAVTANISAASGSLAQILGVGLSAKTIWGGTISVLAGVVKLVAVLAMKIGALAAAWYILKAAKDAAEREEKLEPLRNIMAKKILKDPGTSEYEKMQARRSLEDKWYHLGEPKHYMEARLTGEHGKYLMGNPLLQLGLGRQVTPAMAKIIDEMRNKWKNAQVEPAEKVKGIYEDIQKAMKEAGELSVKAAGLTYDKWVLGTEKMKSAVNRLLGIATYEPPLVKMGTFAVMKKQLTASLKSVKGEYDTGIVNTALRESELAEKLIAKSQSPEGLKPNELAQLQHAVMAMGAAGTWLWRSYGPGIMSKSLFKRFGKDVVGEIAEMGSIENVDYARIIAAMGGGGFAQHMLPGYIPGIGYGPADTAQLGLFAGTLPKPKPVLPRSIMPTGPVFTENAGEELTGQSRLSPAMAHDFNIRRWADPAMNPAWQEIKQELKAMRQALQQTLKVEVVKDGREPMGSTWGFTGES